MIRKKLLAAAKKAALRAFKMEEQAKARETNSSEPAGDKYNPDLIPRVVEGSGDTPGPNHKTLIGRTWLSAQIAGEVSPVLVDLRPPEEWSAGHLPGALLLPGEQVTEDHALLGVEAVGRVTVYDATGGELADRVAEKLRDQGLLNARSLKGGWAEWVEHGEPVTVPPEIPEASYQLGDPVELSKGRQGRIQAIDLVEGSPRYTILLEGSSERLEDVGEDELRR